MAKDKPETVEVPAALWERMQARLEALELAEQKRAEAAANPHALVLDSAWERWKAEAGRPASERSQDVANGRYGLAQPRFRVRLDSTAEDGKPGPRVGEHFALEISANSDLEAQARYLEIMGIKRHEYTLRTEPVAA